MRILTSLAGQMFPRMFFSQLWILIGLHWSGLAHGDKFHSVPHSIMHSMADSTWFAGERRSESHWRFYSDRITILERVSTGICVKGVKKKKKSYSFNRNPLVAIKGRTSFISQPREDLNYQNALLPAAQLLLLLPSKATPTSSQKELEQVELSWNSSKWDRVKKKHLF